MDDYLSKNYFIHDGDGHTYNFKNYELGCFAYNFNRSLNQFFEMK